MYDAKVVITLQQLCHSGITLIKEQHARRCIVLETLAMPCYNGTLINKKLGYDKLIIIHVTIFGAPLFV